MSKDHEGLFRLAYANDPKQIVEIPVGLDNVYRQSGTPAQPLYAKGHWLDENTLNLLVYQGLAKIMITAKFEERIAQVSVAAGLYGVKESFQAKTGE